MLVLVTNLNESLKAAYSALMLSTQLALVQLYLDVQNMLGDLVLVVQFAKHVKANLLFRESAIELFNSSW